MLDLMGCAVLFYYINTSNTLIRRYPSIELARYAYVKYAIIELELKRCESHGIIILDMFSMSDIFNRDSVKCNCIFADKNLDKVNHSTLLFSPISHKLKVENS